MKYVDINIIKLDNQQDECICLKIEATKSVQKEFKTFADSNEDMKITEGNLVQGKSVIPRKLYSLRDSMFSGETNDTLSSVKKWVMYQTGEDLVNSMGTLKEEVKDYMTDCEGEGESKYRYLSFEVQAKKKTYDNLSSEDPETEYILEKIKEMCI